MGDSDDLYKVRNDLASKFHHSDLNGFLIAKGGSCISSIVNPI